MPETKIKLGTFVENFVYASQYVEIVKSGGTIVFCGLASDFLDFIEESENVGDSACFLDSILPVVSSRNCTLVIYVHEEKF